MPAMIPLDLASCLVQTSAEYLFLGLLSEEPASKVHLALPQSHCLSEMSFKSAFEPLPA